VTGRPPPPLEQRKHREHGTRARYMFGAVGSDTAEGCRCWECAQATNVYEKRRVAARRRGVEAFVDAAEAAAHLRWLSANGIGQHRLAAVTGLDSAGLALLAELAARLRANGSAPTIIGSPDGFTDLSAAYRLAPTLDCHALSAAS
jgi:ABC-type transporter Mla MlaB component